MSNILLSETDARRLSNLFPELTPKQFQYLFYYSIGLSSERVSCILGCSTKTVRNQISILKDKLSLTYASDLRVVFITRVILHRNDHL